MRRVMENVLMIASLEFAAGCGDYWRARGRAESRRLIWIRPARNSFASLDAMDRASPLPHWRLRGREQVGVVLAQLDARERTHRTQPRDVAG